MRRVPLYALGHLSTQMPQDRYHPSSFQPKIGEDKHSTATRKFQAALNPRGELISSVAGTSRSGWRVELPCKEIEKYPSERFILLCRALQQL